MQISSQFTNDTIAAIASAPGPAPRGILRISGHTALETVQNVLAPPVPIFHTQRALRYESQLSLDNERLRLPAALYVWPTQRSFTGEPLIEIHTVGSPPLLNEILENLLTSGARPAERGEFTLRAFLAGRIDLMQAEAVLGVIDAANNSQLQTALDQLAGGISSSILTLREELLLHLADLEAGLDFAEEDIDFVQRPAFLARLHAAREFLHNLLDQACDRMQSTARYRVVLAGLPNAGKSTLFNAILNSDRAIVSPIAGTTRDYLVAEVQLAEGLTYELIDTAGWETARDGIESIAGVLRKEQYERADLVIWCAAANATKDEQILNQQSLDQSLQSGRHILHLQTKSDATSQPALSSTSGCTVSAMKGMGLEELQRRIVEELSASTSDSELLGATAARCRESLRHALLAVERASQLVDHSAGDELVAMELREVLDHLGRVVGVVYTDDILDRIFSRFCIGK